MLELDSTRCASGDLTQRELHLQIRNHFKLEKKVSLRLCSERPWYDHYTGGHTVPEHRAVPAGDSSSRYLWRTTLRYCPKLGYEYGGILTTTFLSSHGYAHMVYAHNCLEDCEEVD